MQKTSARVTAAAMMTALVVGMSAGLITPRERTYQLAPEAQAEFMECSQPSEGEYICMYSTLKEAVDFLNSDKPENATSKEVYIGRYSGESAERYAQVIKNSDTDFYQYQVNAVGNGTFDDALNLAYEAKALDSANSRIMIKSDLEWTDDKDVTWTLVDTDLHWGSDSVVISSQLKKRCERGDG